MSSQYERYIGASRPAWMGFCFFGLLLLAFAATEYMYASKFEAEGGKPRFEKPQDERQWRRSIFRRVTVWAHPEVGTWGCVAIFAAPGVVLLATGIWLKRRSSA